VRRSVGRNVTSNAQENQALRASRGPIRTTLHNSHNHFDQVVWTGPNLPHNPGVGRITHKSVNSMYSSDEIPAAPGLNLENRNLNRSDEDPKMTR
jgi:hypothetical protein